MKRWKLILVLPLFFTVAFLIEGPLKSLYFQYVLVIFLLLVGVVRFLKIVFRIKHRETRDRENLEENYDKPLLIKPAQIEKQLEVLCSNGFEIVSPFSCKKLAKIWEEDEGFESWEAHNLKEGILQEALFQLGEEYEINKGYCDNLWWLHFEFIDKHESYKDLAKRLAKMTKGALEITNIKTWYSRPKPEVGFPEDTIWLSFTFEGQEKKIPCRVHEDWLDPHIFSPFIEMLNATDPSKIFVEYELDNQSTIIGCVTKNQLQKLNDLGINFKPLAHRS